MKTCIVADCNGSNIPARGMCVKHYRKFQKYGDPLAVGVRKTAEERFWPMVEKTAGCWNWLASKSRDGYGQFSHNGKITGAHRFAFMLANGPIPNGILIDHRCHSRGCVNPDHLRPATNKQNLENQIGAQINNKTGVRGVYWNVQNKKFHAAVRHNKQAHYVGQFDDLEEASAAVTAKRNELFSHNDADRMAS